MAKISLKSIKFNGGMSPESPPLEIDISAVTIIVGPNNSGKSQLLKEIEDHCHGRHLVARKVLSEINIDHPTDFDECKEMLSIFSGNPPHGGPALDDKLYLNKPNIANFDENTNAEIHIPDFKAVLKNYKWDVIARFFIRYFVLRLDGKTRFNLIEDKKSGDLEGAPKNHLWSLFVDDKKRMEVRKFTERAFGKYFVIDPTGMEFFRARLADRPPMDSMEEQALDARARRFHQSATPITEMGDGIRTSVGLVSAVLSLRQSILLIDEPEAFLHPSLSREVGETIAEASRQQGASLLAATHSADFVIGCIQAAPNTRIVRVDYNGKNGMARSIDPDGVRSLMEDPLLRSTNALRALFTRAVVVCEADTDRAFYEEINRRLYLKDEGIQDCLFLNAQNWQTIPRVAIPLKRLGVPVASIFDLDVLRSSEFTRIWELIDDKCVAEKLQKDRNYILSDLNKVDKNYWKKNGVLSVEGQLRDDLEILIEGFASEGIFFVPVGELEGWLTSLNIPSGGQAKSSWLPRIFQSMGSDPQAASYLAPGQGDVWEFLRRISLWFKT